MRWNPILFRLSAGVAMAALVGEAVLPRAAFAQPAPPPLPSPQGTPRAEQNQPDPPERVGRVARIAGTASFHNPGDTQWTPASVNYPVSTGNSYWTEPNSRVRLEISDSAATLSGATEFDVATLDAAGLQGVAAQGETYLHLRNLQPNEAWSVQTPRGLVKLAGDGRYAIVVGTTDAPTLVTVMDGSADIQGPNLSLHVSAGQTASLTGTDSFEGSIGPALRDPFLQAMLDEERPPAPSRVPQQVSAEVMAMPGGQDVVTTGSWSEAPQYGQVWYPPVDPGWVPYRHGHWAYVAPWGWTWIDDASWGFAPFHYGRWVEVGGRWAWTPGEVAVYRPPVYAPALVAFIGLGAGIAIGAALASGSVGWIPLGPREAYHPWYHASDNYVRQVNVSHVTNITNVTNITTNNFINRGAATSVPAAAMTASRPVAAVAQPVSAEQLAAARPVFGQQPVRPTAATAGVTPTVARQFNIAPAAVAAAHPTVQGPVIRAQAPGPEAGHSPARPSLVAPGQGGRPAEPAIAVPAAPGAAGSRAAAPVPGSRPEPEAPGAGRPPSAEAPRPPAAGTPPAVAGRPGLEAIRPTAPAVAPGAAHPAPPPAAVARPVPAPAPRPEASPVPAPGIRPAAPPPAVHPVPAPAAAPPRPAPVAPPPRPEPAAPAPRPAPAAAAAPHPAPPPAPRPEPARAAPPPQQHAAPPPPHEEHEKKKPGER